MPPAISPAIVATSQMIQTFFQVAAATGILATAGEPPADSTARVSGGRYSGIAADVEITTPSVPVANISVDGRIDDSAWDQAAVLDGFTQFEPVEGSQASQKTEVLVLVDRDALYFAVRAYDDAPEGVRATLSERDAFGSSDDYVRFILDTFDDQRRAYVFTVNPLGVQHDGLWNETGGGAGRRGRGMFSPIDDSPDFIWESDGRITEGGYEAEVRIPFKSLRFPDAEVQSWGLQVERKIQRNGFESSWAPITGNVANKLTQAGKLNDLRDLDMGLSLELNPVVTGSYNGQIDEATGEFGRLDPNGEFGFNAAYGLTSNLKLDATYNPDFSQVEADAGQVQVNERFDLFFAEKRPFFLEGTEIFGMPKQLVYTRTIANPIAGGKVTGKVGSLNVGYLGAVDEGFNADPDTWVSLVRARQDVGASSTIGAVYTDRTVDAGDFNRVAGADARIQLGGRYTVTVMGARSFTNDEELADRADGLMTAARFERAGRSFSFEAELEDTDRDFEPGSGFFRRIGDTQLTSRAELNWYGTRGAILEGINPSVEVQGYWDHDAFWDGGGIEEGEVRLNSRISFRNNVTIWGNVKRTLFSYRPGQYAGLFVQDGASYIPFRPDQSLFDGLTGMSVGIWFNNWERVRGNVRLSFNDTPIFDRAYGVAVEPAESRSGEVRLNLYPTRALRAELSVNVSRLERARDGVEHSTAVIPRLRAQYQFSRALFLRTILEYGHQESEPLMDPATGQPLYECESPGVACEQRLGSVANDFRIEGLVGYEPSPGTVFYLGYTREMEDASAFGFENVRPTRDGLFVKVSYLFRM